MLTGAKMTSSGSTEKKEKSQRELVDSTVSSNAQSNKGHHRPNPDVIVCDENSHEHRIHFDEDQPHQYQKETSPTNSIDRKLTESGAYYANRDWLLKTNKKPTLDKTIGKSPRNIVVDRKLTDSGAFYASHDSMLKPNKKLTIDITKGGSPRKSSDSGGTFYASHDSMLTPNKKTTLHTTRTSSSARDIPAAVGTAYVRRKGSLRMPKFDITFGLKDKSGSDSASSSKRSSTPSPPQSPFSKDLQDASDLSLSLSFPYSSHSLHKPQAWTRHNLDHYDLAAKIILLGDYSVGKTSFIRTLSRAKDAEGCGCCKEYRENELAEVVFRRDNKTAMIRVMDTGGQERYRSMTSSYYRGVHGCVLMFDVTREETFDNVMTWYTDLNKYSTDHYVATILVGTTSLPRERRVPPERGFKLAESLGVPYMECSPEDETMTLAIVQRLTEKVIRFALRRTSFTIEIKPRSEELKKSETKQVVCLC